MDGLRSNPVSYKGAALTGRSCAERILVLKTAIHYFNRFDVCGQMNGVRRRETVGKLLAPAHAVDSGRKAEH